MDTFVKWVLGILEQIRAFVTAGRAMGVLGSVVQGIWNVFKGIAILSTVVAAFLTTLVGASLVQRIISPPTVTLMIFNKTGRGLGSYAIPSNAIPSNAIPSNAIPSNLRSGNNVVFLIDLTAYQFDPFGLLYAIPSNAIPSNAIPSNAIPSNAIPSNAIPSNALPSNFSDSGWVVIGLKAIPSNVVRADLTQLLVVQKMGLSTALTDVYRRDQVTLVNTAVQRFQGAIPSNITQLAIPSNALPSNALPSNIIIKRMTVYEPLAERVCDPPESCIETVSMYSAPNPVSPPSPSERCDEDLSSAQLTLNTASESPDLVVNVSSANGFLTVNYEMDFGYSLPNGVEVGTLPCDFVSNTHMYCYGDPPPADASRLQVTLRPADLSCALANGAFELSSAVAGPDYSGVETVQIDPNACGPASTLAFVRLDGNLTNMQNLALVFRAADAPLTAADTYRATFAPVATGAEQAPPTVDCVTAPESGEISCPLPLSIALANADFVARVGYGVTGCQPIYSMTVDLGTLQANVPAVASGSGCPSLPQATFVNFIEVSRSDGPGLQTIYGKAFFRLETDETLTGKFWLWSPHQLGFWYSQPCHWEWQDALISCNSVHQDGSATSQYLLTYQQGDLPGNPCDQTVRVGDHRTDTVGVEMAYVGDRCGQVWPSMELIVVEYRSSPPAPNNLLDTYIKMPGGIPGVTLNASSGSEQPWTYRMQLASNYTLECFVTSSYPDRLYCPLMPTATQENTFQTFSLYVEGCDAAIETFTKQVPPRTGGSSGSPSCPAGELYHEGWGCCTIGCWCDGGCYNDCPGCPPP